MGRHAMIEVTCAWCGDSFMKRKQRVKKGKKDFCSRNCCNDWQKVERKSERLGKENATKHFDSAGVRYIAQWYDEQTGKLTTTTFAKWLWEMYKGEIPDAYRVGYIDNDSLNCVLDNLYLQSPEEYGRKTSIRNKGVPKSNSHRLSLSKSHMGKTLSESHAKNIADATRRKWANGDFDKVHKGKYNTHWKGGVEKEYPREFYEISSFIRSRDNHVCQVCGKDVYKSRHGHVHHIDGDKMNNVQENLILLCSSCHSKVHHIKKTSPLPILALNSKLKY